MESTNDRIMIINVWDIKDNIAIMSLETFEEYYDVKDEMYAVIIDEQFEHRSYFASLIMQDTRSNYRFGKDLNVNITKVYIWKNE